MHRSLRLQQGCKYSKLWYNYYLSKIPQCQVHCVLTTETKNNIARLLNEFKTDNVFEKFCKNVEALDRIKKWFIDPNSYSKTRKIDPKSCGEFRAAHMIAAFYGYNPDDIQSVSAFKVAQNIVPYERCLHCKVTFSNCSLSQVVTDLSDPTKNISQISIKNIKIFLGEQKLKFLIIDFLDFFVHKLFVV